jgi:predicted aspartyl protease
MDGHIASYGVQPNAADQQLAAAPDTPLQLHNDMQSTSVAQDATVLAEYAGYYTCLQGITATDLRVGYDTVSSSYYVIFSFGPDSVNPYVPFGKFLLSGEVDAATGKLYLLPVRWIVQPPGWVMAGLAGTSRDGGNTFEGNVLLGGCTTFSIHRVRSVASGAVAGPLQNPSPQSQYVPNAGTSSQVSNGHSEIALQKDGGTFAVPVTINDALTLNFAVDSGATDVSIPADVVLTLMRSGTIDQGDFLGNRIYVLADGSTVPSPIFRIRALRVGDREVRNVVANIAPVNGALLLGQSFLSHFASWSIDNRRGVLVLE